ncbi:MAG TPA: Crp/Fnr family transcriptional regulator [Bacteroidia bacterium]|nr:Crp/Fnr family transcriptional regulator [Sphingobacteriales bacterium]HPD63889.1 Crp/Fnr family transcriptional regulator [Bacteroidia bacterium]HRS57750.1 Crp/Fnr family transcriptional regulator [Bacteroidia bacterium]HRU67309.1 Crp/Fnr family transcriptional regulator [Bacteroidia bacterium]
MAENQLYTSCTINSYQGNIFEFLTEEQNQLLDEKSVNVLFKKGETICKKGSFASHISFVESGLVKVFLECQENVLVLKIAPSGNLIGLTSLNEENSTFQYSAMAYIDSKIKQIEIQSFRKIVSENARFAKEIINILNMNSIQINNRFFCLTFKQSYGRLADILLCLADRVFKTTEFSLPLNRKEMAELTGMSTETVVRMIKNFENERLIETKNKFFKILDYDKLQLISQTG